MDIAADGASSPAPLSATQFSSVGALPSSATQPQIPAGGPAAAANASDGPDLSAADRLTMQHVLDLLKAARADAKSADKKIKQSGEWRVTVLVTYMAGLFDGRGLVQVAPLNPGFDGLLGTTIKPDLDTALDEFEANVTSALASTDTRSIIGSGLRALGDCYIAVGAGALIASIVA